MNHQAMQHQTMNHKQPGHDQAFSSHQDKAWVLTTKRAGDRVAGWEIDALDMNTTRLIKESERCGVTSFCYPPGAKLVKATLHRVTC